MAYLHNVLMSYHTPEKNDITDGVCHLCNSWFSNIFGEKIENKIVCNVCEEN